MYHKFTNDLERGEDSPVRASVHTADHDEVVSPMFELQQPHVTNEPKMLSPSDRATSGGSARLTVAVKQASLQKKLKRFASMCMAVVLFAGGLVRRIQNHKFPFQLSTYYFLHPSLHLQTGAHYRLCSYQVPFYLLPTLIPMELE